MTMRALKHTLPLLIAGCASEPRPTAAPLDLDDALAFLEAQPNYLRWRPSSPVPSGLANVRAETCGACHQEIYAEWKISTHARAWLDDAQFQAELAKPREGGGDVSWMCVNCHTPSQGQLPRLVARLEDGKLDRPVYINNPDFDEAFQTEAISCATCHIADGAVLGPYGDTSAPHTVKRDDRLNSAAICEGCHQADVRFDALNLACAFNTGAELEAGPWAAEGYRCQTCHMPEVERPLVAGGPVRLTRRHWFGGSLIPKSPAYAEELAPLAQVYPPGLELGWADLPASVPAGQPVTLTLRYANTRAGHKLPTGDPERYLLIHAEARDSAGGLLAQLDERIGAVYQWYPTIELKSDNRLAPREARTSTLTFQAPSAGEEITLSFEASRWRISPENVAWHQLEGKVVPGQTFASERRTLPLTR